ncbi:hypothetical protein GCM10027614_77800 [Micromonospora vulcania]
MLDAERLVQLRADLPADDHLVGGRLLELQPEQGDEATRQIRHLHGNPSSINGEQPIGGRVAANPVRVGADDGENR